VADQRYRAGLEVPIDRNMCLSPEKLTVRVAGLADPMRNTREAGNDRLCP